MMEEELMLCPGEACPLRLTCRKFHAWLDNEDDEAEEMVPAFNAKTGDCYLYDQIEFYGL